MSITWSQLRGTAGLQRFRVAIVILRKEGVVTCSDFQILHDSSIRIAKLRNIKIDAGVGVRA
jgi:hypothetical protein